jgi:CxxC motif-containing protein
VVKLASLLHAPRGDFWANKRTPAPAQVITKKVKSKKGYTPREAFALVDRTPRT